MALVFYKSVNEFIEEAICYLTREYDLDEVYDEQTWRNQIYIAKEKLIDHGSSADPREAMDEIFSNLKVSKEYYYWDDSCGGVMTNGHHRKVHVKLVKCEEVIRSCQEYLEKHKEVASKKYGHERSEHSYMP